MVKIALDSVYEEIVKAGDKGKTLSAQSKMGFIHELLRMGKISQIGKKYYSSFIVPSKETIYRKIESAAEKGILLSSLEKAIAQDLVNKGTVQKINNRFYLSSSIISLKETIYRKIESAAEKGILLSPMEKAIAQDLINKGTVQKVSNRFYLTSWTPRTQKAIIEWLLEQGSIKKVGKKFVIIGKVQGPPRIQPVLMETPSFLEFLEAFQKIYQYLAGGYQRSVSIVPLINGIKEKTNFSRSLIEKWILELPHIFIGSVDLRPFPGEPGISLKDGTEVNRIYVERELVGL